MNRAHARALAAMHLGAVPMVLSRAASQVSPALIIAPAPVQKAGMTVVLQPWPDSAPHVVLNGQPITAQDYADDDTFVQLYNQMVHTYLYADSEKRDSINNPDPAKRAYAKARAVTLYGSGGQIIAKLQAQVAHDATDPGRWIVHHDPIASFVEDIANGKSIIQAFEDAGTALVANIKDVGPYVQTVVSFIPGFGTAAAACIGAAVALAKGEDIGDGLIDAVSGALPGGVVTGMAVRAGVTAIKDACEGKTWQQTLWDAAREAIPAGPARMAFDAGVALGGAALSQADPAAAQAIFTGATQNGAQNTSAPAPKLPTPAQVTQHAQAAQAAYEQKQLPPAPPWQIAQGVPMPPTTPLQPSKAPYAVFAGAFLVGVKLFR